MFHFRFETLLNVRRHAEECLQKELSEARQALTDEQSVLRDKKNARRQCLQEQRRKQHRGFRGPDMLLFGNYLQRLERDIDAQQKRVATAERRVGQKRQALIEAMKKRKIIEKIKEKDRDSHLRALAELERKFIDEAAARSHSAARSG
ncbi:MAG: flagellar export protein FliJ [Desulfobacterales bacterium]|nr:flagellar export protein FliJ [Desulfobacterales bacterium]